MPPSLKKEISSIKEDCSNPGTPPIKGKCSNDVSKNKNEIF